MAASSSVGPIAGSQNIPAHFHQQGVYGANGRLTPEVLPLLQGAIASAACAKGKEIVAILGYTGCGKSTLVNNLLGRTILYNRPKGRYEVAPGEGEIAKIGQNRLTSETLFPTPYQGERFPFTLLDCGGLLDTRGVNTDIAVATSIKLALENAGSVRLLLCFESISIDLHKSQGFIQFLNTILGSLVKDYTQHPESIHLLFTKPYQTEDGIVFDKNRAIAQLTGIESDIPEGALKDLFRFILRVDGQYISVHNYQNPDSRKSTKRAIKKLTGIQETRTAFQTFFASQSAVVIREALTTISVSGLELYRRYFQLSESYARENAALGQLIQRIQGITEQFARLGGGEQNPDLINDIGEGIRQQHLQIVSEQTQSIQDNEALKAATHERINGVLQKIEQWNIAGEIPDLYWEDGVNEKGIEDRPRIETRTLTKTTGALFWKKTKTHTESYTVIDKIPLVIPRHFQYIGPTVETVVKTPPDSPCWSNEKFEEENRKYSIHYESKLGEDAVANVKVYVKRKNKPDEIASRGALDSEHRSEVVELSRLEESIRTHLVLREMAQRNAEAKKHDLAWIEEQKISLKDFQERKGILDEKLAGLDQEKQAIQTEITENLPQFKFLIDFLHLSRDEKMANGESIGRFIALNQRYNEEVGHGNN